MGGGGGGGGREGVNGLSGALTDLVSSCELTMF